MGLLKKSLESIITQAAGLAFGLASGVIIARTLGPADKGAIALYTMLISLLATIGNPGLGSANIFLVGSGRLQAPKAWANSWWISWIAGLVLGLAAFFFLPLLAIVFKRPLDIGHLFIALMGLPLTILLDCQINLLRGLQKIDWFNAAQLVRQGMRTLLVAALVAELGYRVAGALWAANLAMFSVLLLTALALRREKALRLMPSIAGLRESLRYGLALQPGQIVQFLNYRLDLFLLAFLADSWQVGLYTTGVFIAELVWYIPHGVNIVLFPAVSATGDHIQAAKISARLMKHSVLWSLLLAIGLWLSAPHLIAVLYGPAFGPSAAALRILLLGVLAMVPGKLALNHLAGIGRPQYLSYAAFIGLAATVILDLLLIPKWGFLGAAWAAVIAYLLIAGISLYWWKRWTKMGLKETLVIGQQDLGEYLRYLT